MSNPIVIVVSGIPVARPRPRHRALRAGGRIIVKAYHPKGDLDSEDSAQVAWAKANRWFDAVKQGAELVRPPDAPWRGPIRCTIEFFMPRLKKHDAKKYGTGPLWCANKPDRDNLDKSILDSITAAGIWVDDAQVCDGRISKMYPPVGCGTGVIITIERIAEDA